MQKSKSPPQQPSTKATQGQIDTAYQARLRKPEAASPFSAPKNPEAGSDHGQNPQYSSDVVRATLQQKQPPVGNVFGDRWYQELMHNNSAETFHNESQISGEIVVHSHNFYEILFILSGDVYYEVEGYGYQLKQGDLVLINPLELHHGYVHTTKPYRRFVTWLHPNFIAKLEQEQPLEMADNPMGSISACFKQAAVHGLHVLPLNPNVQQDLTNLLTLAARFTLLTEQDSPNSRSITCHLLASFVGMVNDLYFGALKDKSLNPSIRPKQPLAQAVDFIHNHLTQDELLSVPALAQRYDISPSQFLRVFKQHMGYTPHQYIIQRRLIQAKYLLSLGTSPLEAANLSGFKNYAHFSRSFKQCFQQSPSDYKSSLEDRDFVSPELELAVKQGKKK